jgi:Na+-translocating ferredoxin:NAD+ oxidoreductase subunit B
MEVLPTNQEKTMGEDVFRRLQQQLDQYSIGFPASESGIEIELLKEMFTQEDADLFTALTAELETPESVSDRINKPVEEVAKRLEDMAGKGLLFRKRQGRSIAYSAVPFIHGLLEFQVVRPGVDVKRIIKMTGQYVGEKLKHNMAEGSDLFLRTIPVHRSISAMPHVAPYEDAREILRKEKLIVLTDCACRKQKSYFGKDCGKPMEVCFMFGSMGEYYVENGLGREIDLKEALEVLEKAHDAGLITQPAAAMKPFTMCNCCVDCCGFLRAASKHPNPADLVFSNFTVKVDLDKCSGCGTCVSRCGMEAVKMNAEGKAETDPARCIGCGLCVTTCPEEGARELTPKTGQSHRIPPADTPSQMKALAGKRGMTRMDPSRIVTFGF